MARTCLGGLTLLLALTLSVRGVAMSSGVQPHRPAVVQAVVRLLAAASEKTPDVRERRDLARVGRATGPAGVVRMPADTDGHADRALLREHLNLPPPARA